MGDLVLSLFPGADLLGLGFQEAWPELCIVRGPDIIHGSLHDVRKFHVPRRVFKGIFGGPPCQHWSRLVHIVRHRYGEEAVAEDLIPELVRIVLEGEPDWFVMEQVPEAPVPVVPGYGIHCFLLNNRWLGQVQERKRRFSFGLRGERSVDLRRWIEWAPLEAVEWTPAVLASVGNNIKQDRGGKPKKNRLSEMGYTSRLSVAEALRRQGLPADFFAHSPLTVEGQQKLIGNGVPLPMGRAVAQAVRRALEEIESGAAA